MNTGNNKENDVENQMLHSSWLNNLKGVLWSVEHESLQEVFEYYLFYEHRYCLYIYSVIISVKALLLH